MVLSCSNRLMFRLEFPSEQRPVDGRGKADEAVLRGGAEQREADERGRGRDDDDLLLFQRKSFKQDTCCWPHRLHHFYFPLFLFFIVENTMLEDDRPRIQRNTVDIDRNRANIQTKFSQKAQNPQMMQYRCKYNRNPIKSDRIWTEFQLEPNEVQCNDQLELMVTEASG